MAEVQVMAYRVLCEHGKVRAMMTDPKTGDHSEEYLKDAPKELAKMAKWAHTIERVTIEEARQSDMECDVCDAPKMRKGKAAATEAVTA